MWGPDVINVSNLLNLVLKVRIKVRKTPIYFLYNFIMYKYIALEFAIAKDIGLIFCISFFFTHFLWCDNNRPQGPTCIGDQNQIKFLYFPSYCQSHSRIGGIFDIM